MILFAKKKKNNLLMMEYRLSLMDLRKLLKVLRFENFDLKLTYSNIIFRRCGIVLKAIDYKFEFQYK